MTSVLRPATAADLDAVVRTHVEAFPGFFLTTLGPRFLHTYYRLVLDTRDAILLVAEATEEAGIVGFVAGSLDPAAFYVAMRAHRLRFAVALAPALVRRPAIARRVLQSARRPPTPPGAAELASLAVRPTAEGGGVGRALVTQFVQEARQRGANSVCLTTDAVDNERVLRFYELLGFSASRRFDAPGGRAMLELVRLS